MSLCSQGQLPRTCLAACCVFLALVQSCSTPMAPLSQRPQARPGALKSFPVTQVGSFSCCRRPLTGPLLLLSSSSSCQPQMSVCMHIYVCAIQWGLGHQVWPLGEYIPEVCVCICHHICVHLPVFQGRSACASKRQLMVSLEGPPGVFAPVVELCGWRIGDSSCPQSVLLCQFFFYPARLNI